MTSSMIPPELQLLFAKERVARVLYKRITNPKDPFEKATAATQQRYLDHAKAAIQDLVDNGFMIIKGGVAK